MGLHAQLAARREARIADMARFDREGAELAKGITALVRGWRTEERQAINYSLKSAEAVNSHGHGESFRLHNASRGVSYLGAAGSLFGYLISGVVEAAVIRAATLHELHGRSAELAVAIAAGGALGIAASTAGMCYSLRSKGMSKENVPIAMKSVIYGFFFGPVGGAIGYGASLPLHNEVATAASTTGGVVLGLAAGVYLAIKVNLGKVLQSRGGVGAGMPPLYNQEDGRRIPAELYMRELARQAAPLSERPDYHPVPMTPGEARIKKPMDAGGPEPLYEDNE